MQVLVTGASGRVGVAVVRDLLEAGHHIRTIDRTPPSTKAREELRAHPEWQERLENIYDDVTDRLALLRAAKDCKAIVHLAALPHPRNGNEMTITQINAVGTQYVLAAAEAHDIQRVVLASSCCVYGWVFAREKFDPQYFPVDENHPRLPQDLYGLSKIMNEETAATYTRRCGMTTVCLRLTGVMQLNGEHSKWHRQHIESSGQWKSTDYWTYVDERDTARAFRLGIEKEDLKGSHSLVIAARDSLSPYDVRELVKRHLPDFAESVKDLAPRQSLYSTTRAEEVLGWVPEHSWRDSTIGIELMEKLRAQETTDLPLAD